MLKTFSSLILLINLFAAGSLSAEEYMSQQAFIEKHLGQTSQAKMLWITSTLRTELEQNIGISPEGARLRYWQSGEQRAWIVEEIGRDKLITMGFVMEAGKVKKFEVLAFRESRGYEIKYPVFSEKLSGLFLSEAFDLSHQVDNITGATLSVNAVKKSARLVLYLDAHLENAN